jgi:dihydrofolate reductase
MKIIVAVNSMGYIGKDDQMLWKCPEDLKHFKRTTMGAKCLVGRKTFESLPPLKGRELIVVGQGYNTLEEGLAQSPDFCIGGEQLYQACLPLATEIHISYIQNWSVGNKKFWIPDELAEKWSLFKLTKGKKGIKQPEITNYFMNCPDDDDLSDSTYGENVTKR